MSWVGWGTGTGWKFRTRAKPVPASAGSQVCQPFISILLPYIYPQYFLFFVFFLPFSICFCHTSPRLPVLVVPSSPLTTTTAITTAAAIRTATGPPPPPPPCQWHPTTNERGSRLVSSPWQYWYVFFFQFVLLY